MLIASAWGGCHCPAHVPPGADGGEDGGVLDGGVLDGGSDAGAPDAGNPDGGSDAGTCIPPYSGNGTPLANGLQVPRRLAVDDAALYVSEAGRSTRQDGVVLRIPLGGDAGQPFATGLSSPDALAVDSSAVYVLTDLGLARLDKAASPTPITNAPIIDPVINNAISGGTEVALSANEAVVATGFKWLTKVGKDGSGHVDLYTGPAGAVVRSVAIDEGQAYFLVAGVPESGLYQVPIDGSAAATRLRPEPSDGNTLLVTPTDFIWAEGSGGNGAIRKAPRSGGAATDLATGLTHPSRLALVGTTLYFKNSVLGGADFFRSVSLCQPGTSTPVGPSGDGPGDVVSAPSGLYFSSQGTSPAGSVSRLP